MTSSELIQDGIRYVPSKAAAKGVGLSPDYISRLCREGQVLGAWHRGAWYVHEPSLARFAGEKRKRQEELAQAQAEKLKREREQAEAAARNAKAIATWRRRARPVALATITLLIATSAAALARPTFEHIAPQLPSDAKAQLASVATSLETLREIASNIASSITDKIGNFLAPVETAPTPIVFVPKLIATPTPSQTAQTDLQPPSQTVINQPVIERVVESVRTIVSGGISEAFLDARLAALDQDLSIRMNQVALAGAYQTNRTYDVLATALRIEELADLILHRPRIDGGTITGAAITGGSLSGVSLAADDLTGVIAIANGGTGTTTSPSYGRLLVGNALGGYDLVATSSLGIEGGGGGGAFGQTWEIANDALAPTTTLGIIVSASSTFSGGLSATDATTTNATSTSLFASLARFTTSIADALTAAAATIIDLTATTLTAQNASTTIASAYDGVFVGRTATTTIRGSATSTFAAGIETAALNVTNSTATSTFANGIQLAAGCFRDASGSCITNAGGTSWGSIIGTLSDQSDLQGALNAKFSLADWYATTTDGLPQGSTNLYYSDTLVNAFLHSSTTIPKTYTANAFTALQTFGNASTTNLSASYASSTQGFFGSLSVGNLTGFLKATAGAIATAAIDLASDVTGILGVARGGTGWAAVEAGSVLYGNGGNALATTSAGTAGQVLALLNGVPTWTATTTFSSPLLYANGNVTLDTSGNWSGTFDGQEGSYFLNAANLTNFGVPFFSFFSATNTDALAEGASNLYWTNARFDSRLAATTSLPNITTLANLSITESQISDLAHYTDADAQAFIHASTTIPKTYSNNTFTGSNTFSSLTLSSFNGPLQANAGLLSATTSIGVLYGGTGLTSAPTYGQVLVGNALGGYTLTATSSLGLSTFGYLFPSNATSTLLSFNSGLLSLASTTIGNGAQAGGLTISGGATTTGFLVVQGSATSTFTGGIQSPALNITSTSATSTFANGIRLSSGCFQMADGNCAGSGGGSGTIGSGTTGQFPYYAANGTTLTATSSLFLATSGNVGMGTTSPQKNLHIEKSTNDEVGVLVHNPSTGSNAYTTFVLGNSQWEPSGNNGLALFLNSTARSIDGGTNTGTLRNDLGDLRLQGADGFDNALGITIKGTSGNVGIGTTSPWARLSIESNGLGSTPAFAIGSSTATNFVVTNAGNVGIGTTSPTSQLHIASNAGTNQLTLDNTSGSSWKSQISFQSTSTERWSLGIDPGEGGVQEFFIYNGIIDSIPFFIDGNDNVGIGTTTPLSKLQVNANTLYDDDEYAAHGFSIASGAPFDSNMVLYMGTDSTNDVSYIQSVGFGTFMPLVLQARGGNVGIGTSSPPDKLSVQNGAIANYIQDSSDEALIAARSNDYWSTFKSVNLSYYGTGAVGDQITGVPNAELGLLGFTNTGNALIMTNGGAPLIFGTFSEERMRITNTGNVGIASSSPWRTFSAEGTVGLSSSITSAQTGHVLCINSSTWEVVRDTSPASPCTSSLRAHKQSIADLSEGLDAVLRLRPVEFDWKPGFGNGHDFGFIAEEVASSVPLLADYDPETGALSSVKYMNMPALLTKAIQQIATITGTFKQNLIAWLADATNGIERVVANTFTGRLFKGDRAEFEELCVGSVCVTEADFMATFGAAASAPSASGASPTNPALAAQPSHPEQASTTESVPSSPSYIRDLAATSTPADLTDSEQPPPENSTPAEPELPAEASDSNDATERAAEQTAASSPPEAPAPANDNPSTDAHQTIMDDTEPEIPPEDRAVEDAAA